jgi:hypothetical protein
MKEGRILLLSALKWAAQEWVAENMIVDMARLSDPPIKHAFEAILAPARLAEMIVSEARRGVVLRFLHVGATAEQTKWLSDNALTEPHVFLFHGRGKGNDDLRFTMPQARTVLAALIALPDGAKDEAEKILRGEHG